MSALIDQQKHISDILATKTYKIRLISEPSHIAKQDACLSRDRRPVFTSQLIQFSYILLLSNLLCQKSVLQLLSLHYLSVPLVRGNPAPPLTGLQPVVDPAIFPRSGFGLLLFLLPFMSSYLPTSLAAGSRYYPVTVSGIVSPYGQKPSAAMGGADFRQPFPCTDPCTESW